MAEAPPPYVRGSTFFRRYPKSDRDRRVVPSLELLRQKAIRFLTLG